MTFKSLKRFSSLRMQLVASVFLWISPALLLTFIVNQSWFWEYAPEWLKQYALERAVGKFHRGHAGAGGGVVRRGTFHFAPGARLVPGGAAVVGRRLAGANRPAGSGGRIGPARGKIRSDGGGLASSAPRSATPPNGNCATTPTSKPSSPRSASARWSATIWTPCSRRAPSCPGRCWRRSIRRSLSASPTDACCCSPAPAGKPAPLARPLPSMSGIRRWASAR